MSRVAIAGYGLSWNPEQKIGEVTLRYQYGQQVKIRVNSAEELTAMAMILNESPVFYDEDSRSLVTGWEEVGGS